MKLVLPAATRVTQQYNSHPETQGSAGDSGARLRLSLSWPTGTAKAQSSSNQDLDGTEKESTQRCAG